MCIRDSRTYGGVSGRRLVTASYSIMWAYFLKIFLKNLF